MDDCYLYVLADALRNKRQTALNSEIGREFRPSTSYTGWDGSAAMLDAYLLVCADLCNRTHERRPAATSELQQGTVDLRRT